jgi:hypothetical protein
MANFFFMGGDGTYSGFNMDQVRQVIRDNSAGKVTVIFSPDHTVELFGDVAKQFIDILTRLNSEASAAVVAAKAASKK